MATSPSWCLATTARRSASARSAAPTTSTASSRSCAPGSPRPRATGAAASRATSSVSSPATSSRSPRSSATSPSVTARRAGRPLLAHAVEAIEANRCTAAVVVVGHPDALEDTAKLVAEEGFTKVTAVIAGGPTRRTSVAAGLRALPPGLGYVAVHDVARPLVGPGVVDRMLGLLLEAGAAGVVPGVPVTDTIRGVDAVQRSTGIVDREQMRAMQTPQLFVREVLEAAYRLALRERVEAADAAAL